MITCTRCDITKDVGSFYKRGDQLRPECKLCANLLCREYRAKQKTLDITKPKKVLNIDEYNIILQKKRQYYIDNKSRISIKNKEQYQYDRDKVLAKNKKWKQQNPDYHWQYISNRICTDINLKIRISLRSRLHAAIKNNRKSGSAVNDLGCSVEELKQHLESRFQYGMTWDNWNRNGWHIDHVKPLVSFDLSNREELLKACYYTNLQPLWAEDNLIKGGKNGN